MEGGHRPWLWVEISAPDEPEERFVGENKLFEITAEDNQIPVEDLKRGYPEELYWSLRKKISQNPYTPEYVNWQKKNEELRNKVLELVGEFYSDREVDSGTRLKVSESKGGSFEVGSEDEILVRFLNNELSKDEKINLLEKLPRRQKEMSEFTEFLKKRFFEGKGD